MTHHGANGAEELEDPKLAGQEGGCCQSTVKVTGVDGQVEAYSTRS